jgi:hypothetical protein
MASIGADRPDHRTFRPIGAGGARSSRRFRAKPFPVRNAGSRTFKKRLSANVSLRSSAVRGQLGEGLRHESFDIGGWNAKDRSRFALVALQSRLRDIIAPALGPLPRPGRAHPVAAIVEELPPEQGFGRLARSLSPRSAQMIAQASLDVLPQLLGHDRRVLAFVHLALMGDPADIDRVRQEFIDMPRLSRPPPVERLPPSMRIGIRTPSASSCCLRRTTLPASR